MFYSYGKLSRDFVGRPYFYFSLVCYVLGAFLIKQVFHSRLLDMRIIANLVLRASLAIYHLISNVRLCNVCRILFSSFARAFNSRNISASYT